MLFAETSEGNPFGFLILMFIVVMGIRQLSIWLGGNKQVGGAVKKGAIGILGRLFK